MTARTFWKKPNGPSVIFDRLVNLPHSGHCDIMILAINKEVSSRTKCITKDGHPSNILFARDGGTLREHTSGHHGV